MGAVTFSLDPRLVAALKTELPISILIETGTFKGDTVAALWSYFNKVISIEASEILWAAAAKRFEEYPQIQVLLGNSKDKLPGLQAELQDVAALYWLDAHWCADPYTYGVLSQCPLLEELHAIGSLNSESVVLIDDARLFLAPPQTPHEISQWPGFHDIVSCLLSKSSAHQLMIVNDVIVFFPKKAAAAMALYAQSYGIDWSLAANCLKENDGIMRQLGEKEIVIQEQAKALQIYNSLFWPFRPFLPLAIRAIEILSPRLGNLNQYQPRALTAEPSAINIRQLTATPKIAMVTPSFQQSEYIERTLLSVLDQGYPNLEYFVQDGGSKDSTVTLLKKFEGQLAGWASEQDTGQSQAINSGFLKTTGDIMGWLNSDDLLLPNALMTVADFFNRHPEVDVVYGNRLLIDENDREIGRWILPGHDENILAWADFIPQETLFWRRRLWDKTGARIDESFSFAMDWDLLLRFREAGAKFAHIPRFLGAFRIHPRQKTVLEINRAGHQEMDRLRERSLGHVPTRIEIRKAILVFLLKHIAVDIIYRLKTSFGRRLW